MKQLLSLVCVFAIAFSSWAQDKNFDLSKYKFPDYKRHELELNFNSDGYSNRNKVEYPNNLNNEGNSHYISSSNNSQTNAQLNYSYYFLNRKRIDYLHSSISGNYRYSSNTNSNSKIKDFQHGFDLSLRGSRTMYMNESKFFIEGLTDIDINQDNSLRTIDNERYPKDRFSTLDLSIGAGFGVGRIEIVSDLWQSHFILEKLKKKKLLAKELTYENVYEFAQLTSRLKNKRFFDSRIRKMEELQSVDSLLHNQGLIVHSDIIYFTELNDYWSYGNFTQRKSGKVLKFWISPEYAKAFNKNSTSKSFNPHKTSLVSNLSFNCHKQLNLYWERQINLLLSYESVINMSGIYYTNYQKNNFNPNLNVGFGFFPDSRTSVSGHLGYYGHNLFISNATTVMPRLWINSVYFDLIGFYYISPQLQLTGRVELNFSDKGYKVTDNLNTVYNLGLRYAIF